MHSVRRATRVGDSTVVGLARANYSSGYRMKTILLASAIWLAGCETVQYKTVEVPVRVSCVSSVPPKPAKPVKCVLEDSECVKQAGRDIERLDSALDQVSELLRACQ